jgi:hypothetical protein
MEKRVPQNPANRLIGIFPILFGAAFIYFIHTTFTDEFFSGIRPVFYVGGGVTILFGLYLLLSTTEMIYDDQTIEKRTKFLGFTWSHKVDRSLVRDIGPEAAGLVARRPHSHFHHNTHDD